MASQSIFRKVYNFYSKDLTQHEFERIFVKEAQVRYKYYLRSMAKPVKSENKFREVLTFTKNFAIAFLEKLSPVIRIVYTAAVVLFIIALMSDNFDAAILSFIVINLIFIFEVADMLTARDELEVARHVQTSLIPVKPPAIRGYEVACHYETAREVGGDFIDFISQDDGSTLVTIGDVSGKGMSAALYMVQVRLLLRHISDTFANPKKILSSLNSVLFRHVKKGLYFSAVLAEVKDSKITVCRAGHTPCLLIDSNGTCSEIRPKGMALGLCEGIKFEDSLETFEIIMKEGDILFMYSDGLSEAMNAAREEFGINRIKDILVSSKNSSTEALSGMILGEVNRFRGFAEVHDDLTFILLKSKQQ